LFGLNNALFLHVISYFIKLNKQHISSVFSPFFTGFIFIPMPCWHRLWQDYFNMKNAIHL